MLNPLASTRPPATFMEDPARSNRAPGGDASSPILGVESFIRRCLECSSPPRPVSPGSTPLSGARRVGDYRAGAPRAGESAREAERADASAHALSRTSTGRIAYWREPASQLLVVPSLDYDPEEMKKVVGAELYEERHLFNLLLLDRPDRELVFVTSRPVDPVAVDYFLSLRSGRIEPSQRHALRMVAVEGQPGSSLSERLLSAPGERQLVEALKSGVQPLTGMSVFTSSASLERIASRIGVPMLAPRAAKLSWGTKGGSRLAFGLAGVPHPTGVPSAKDGDLLDARGYIASDRDLARGLARALLREAEPRRAWMVKLNEGFSGEGNAILDLGPVVDRFFAGRGREAAVAPDEGALTEAILEHFPNMRCAAGEAESWPSFREKMPRLGVIAEAFLQGEEVRPPSCQGLVHEDGRVEILSTHEQLLGGQEGQIYLGCEFPARADYRAELQRHTRAVGEVLAKDGVVGLFGVDFLATRSPAGQGPWKLDALEINLRATATTHPFMTLSLLTGGSTGSDGRFLLSDGSERTYVANDNLRKAEYVGLTPSALVHEVRRQPLHWDSARGEGVVLHLLGALEPYGKVGYTAIAKTREGAERLRQSLEHVLDGLATRNQGWIQADSLRRGLEARSSGWSRQGSLAESHAA